MLSNLLRLVVWLVAFAVFSPAHAEPTIITDHFQRVDLGPGLEYLEDKEGTLTLEDVVAGREALPWQTSTQQVLNFGYVSATYWVRFSIQSESLRSQSLWAEVAYPLLDSVQVYVLREGELVQRFDLGDQRPFSERRIPHVNFLFPVEIPSSANLQVLLRVQSDSSLQIPIRLWDKEAFVAHDHADSLLYGIFYGGMLILGFYHLLIFLSLREPSFLYFAMLLLCGLSSWATIKGFTPAFVWPTSGVSNETMLLLSTNISVVFVCLFSQSLLRVPATHPRLGLVLRMTSYAAGLSALGALLLPYSVMITGTLVVCFAAILVNLYTHVVRMFDGYPPAKFTVLAGIPYITGFGALILSRMGIFPATSEMLGASYACILIFFVLYALALSSRMNMDRHSREAAQLEATNTQRQLLETQVKLNEELDRMVSDRTEALAQANVKLQEMSTTDELTQLRNRCYFNEVLAKECKRAQREVVPLSVLLLDIDYFKKINDTFGHPFGDLCLVRAGQIIEGHLRRPPDLAARYGGEEFVVLLPNTQQEGAVNVAESIRSAFCSAVVQQGDIRVEMTVSIGIAGMSSGDDSPEDILKRADEQLYRAKENGRNRVE